MRLKSLFYCIAHHIPVVAQQDTNGNTLLMGLWTFRLAFSIILLIPVIVVGGSLLFTGIVTVLVVVLACYCKHSKADNSAQVCTQSTADNPVHNSQVIAARVVQQQHDRGI